MITIVSGLPRSGTSLMMRMLDVGGIPTLVDHIRQPDIDNPRGYYELEKVKQIAQDASFLEDAKGHVFKMVSMLLRHLPQDHTYHVVFMQRHIDEVIASQNKMLERLKKTKTGDDEEVKTLLQKHLADIEAWLEQQAHIHVLYVRYNDLLADPTKHTERVCDFLGQESLNKAKMISVIDPTLYRQRKAGL